MEYDNYFKDQYLYQFSTEELNKYANWFYPQIGLINRKAPIDVSKRILEIGSGIGGFYNLIKPKSYVGLELDKNAVAFARKQFQTECFQNVRIEDFCAGTPFDCIFAFEVLEHLENPYKTISKIKELLAEKGVFIGTSPFPFAKNIFADKTHLSVLHPENWRVLFLKNGFKEVSLTPMSFFPVLWRINKRLNVRLPFYVPFPGWISTCLIIARR